MLKLHFKQVVICEQVRLISQFFYFVLEIL